MTKVLLSVKLVFRDLDGTELWIYKLGDSQGFVKFRKNKVISETKTGLFVAGVILEFLKPFSRTFGEFEVENFPILGRVENETFGG